MVNSLQKREHFSFFWPVCKGSNTLKNIGAVNEKVAAGRVEQVAGITRCIYMGNRSGPNETG